MLTCGVPMSTRVPPWLKELYKKNFRDGVYHGEDNTARRERERKEVLRDLELLNTPGGL